MLVVIGDKIVESKAIMAGNEVNTGGGAPAMLIEVLLPDSLVAISPQRCHPSRNCAQCSEFAIPFGPQYREVTNPIAASPKSQGSASV
jgi:hypothetical protein